MDARKKPVVIELYAGPGAGKSTLAAGLFALMKSEGYKVELVTELAKDITYEKAFGLLRNQFFVTANQEHRQWRLRDSVDFIITDSPVAIGLAYCPAEDFIPLRQLCKHLRTRYLNIPILVRRVKTYAQYGRSETENEARAIDRVVQDIWQGAPGVARAFVDGDNEAPYRVLRDVIEPYIRNSPHGT